MDIDAYSATFTGVQLGGRGEGPPLSFSENHKKCTDFGKKALIVSIFGLNFPFKMYFSRVSWRKNSTIFPCAAFDEMFVEVPLFHETSPALKNFWFRTCTQVLFFLQKAPS